MKKNFCGCGCRELAKEGNQFIKGHNIRGKNNPMYGKTGKKSPRYKPAIHKIIFCNCGCGKVAKEGNRFINGHNSKGENNPNYGKTWTLSDKTRKKISNALKGKPSPMKGNSISEETKNRIYESCQTPEYKKIKHELAKKQWQNPEFRKSMTGEKHPMFGKHHTAKARARIGEAQKGEKNTNYGGLSDETKEKLCKLWKDPEFVKMMRKSQHLKPNLLENDFASAFPELRYVGDLAFFVGSKNPDFILPNTNIAIDLFGDYWHEPDEVHGRKKYFKEYGYELHIFWEHEWKNERLKVESQVNNIVQNVKEMN